MTKDNHSRTGKEPPLTKVGEPVMPTEQESNAYARQLNAIAQMGVSVESLNLNRNKKQFEALLKVKPQGLLKRINEAALNGRSTIQIKLDTWIHPDNSDYLLLKNALLKNPAIENINLELDSNYHSEYTESTKEYKRFKFYDSNIMISLKDYEIALEETPSPSVKQHSGFFDRFKNHAPALQDHSQYERLDNSQNLEHRLTKTLDKIKLDRRRIKGLKVNTIRLTSAVKAIKEILDGENTYKVEPLDNALYHLEVLSESFSAYANVKKHLRRDLSALAKNFNLVVDLIKMRTEESVDRNQLTLGHDTAAHTQILKMEML